MEDHHKYPNLYAHFVTGLDRSTKGILPWALYAFGLLAVFVSATPSANATAIIAGAFVILCLLGALRTVMHIRLMRDPTTGFSKYVRMLKSRSIGEHLEDLDHELAYPEVLEHITLTANYLIIDRDMIDGMITPIDEITGIDYSYIPTLKHRPRHLLHLGTLHIGAQTIGERHLEDLTPHYEAIVHRRSDIPHTQSAAKRFNAKPEINELPADEVTNVLPLRDPFLDQLYEQRRSDPSHE